MWGLGERKKSGISMLILVNECMVAMVTHHSLYLKQERRQEYYLGATIYWTSFRWYFGTYIWRRAGSNIPNYFGTCVIYYLNEERLWAAQTFTKHWNWKNGFDRNWMQQDVSARARAKPLIWTKKAKRMRHYNCYKKRGT